MATFVERANGMSELIILCLLSSGVASRVRLEGDADQFSQVGSGGRSSTSTSMVANMERPPASASLCFGSFVTSMPLIPSPLEAQPLDSL